MPNNNEPDSKRKCTRGDPQAGRISLPNGNEGRSLPGALSSSVENPGPKAGGWTSLPGEVLLLVLSLAAATPADLLGISSASKAMRKLVKDHRCLLCKGIADHRYGKNLAEDSVALYHHDYEAMLRHDNRRGALLMVVRTAENNSWEGHYGSVRCSIEGLAFDRSNHFLYLYLDARGIDSELLLQDIVRSVVVWWPPHNNHDIDSINVRPTQEYFELLEPAQPGWRGGVARYDILRLRERNAPSPVGGCAFHFRTGSFHWAPFHWAPPGWAPPELRIGLFDLDRGDSIESALRRMPGFRYGRKPAIRK